MLHVRWIDSKDIFMSGEAQMLLSNAKMCHIFSGTEGLGGMSKLTMFTFFLRHHLVSQSGLASSKNVLSHFSQSSQYPTEHARNQVSIYIILSLNILFLLRNTLHHTSKKDGNSV